MDEKQLFYRSIAHHLRAGRLLRGYDLVAHVEGTDDVVFWTAVFAHALPGLKVQILPSTQSASGAIATGKQHCLKYVDFLDKYFVVCVDSDFDWLLDTDARMAKSFVLQTYTYSWENHTVAEQGLAEETTNLPFDFALFLRDFSRVIYHPLLRLLYGKKFFGADWTLENMCSLILRHPVNKDSLEQNGASLLNTIREELQTRVAELSPVSESDMWTFAMQMQAKGLTEENAYLYMQGHCVYDLILRMGRFLMNKADFEALVMSRSLRLSGYPESENLLSDARKLNNNQH